MIDVTMLESMLSLTLSEIQSAQFYIPPIPRQIFGPVQCKNGYIMLAVASERTFQNMAIASRSPGLDVGGPALQALRQPPQQLGRD